MRNLFVFIWKYHFFILFLLLESACFYLLVLNNNFQRASVINTANSVSGSVLGYVGSLKEYIHLRESNQQLAMENARLRTSVRNMYYELGQNKDTISDTLHK